MKNGENRKNYEEKFTGSKQLEERRHKVYILDLQGISNNEIATKLGVSLSTIEKDLHYMKYYCLKWSKDIIETGIKKPFVDSIMQIDLIQKELWSLYREEKNVTVKKKLLDSIVSNSIKQKELFKKAPYFGEYSEQKLQRLEKELNIK